MKFSREMGSTARTAIPSGQIRTYNMTAAKSLDQASRQPAPPTRKFSSQFLVSLKKLRTQPHRSQHGRYCQAILLVATSRKPWPVQTRVGCASQQNSIANTHGCTTNQLAVSTVHPNWFFDGEPGCYTLRMAESMSCWDYFRKHTIAVQQDRNPPYYACQEADLVG
jgi:hypothetical protein